MWKMFSLISNQQMAKHLIFALLILFFTTGCATRTGAPKYQKKSSGSQFLKIDSSNQIIYLTPEEVKERIDLREDFSLVDIRPTSLYERAHIIGAISIPFEEIIFRFEELDPRNEIVLYCQTGQTCLSAFELFSKLGFEDVKIMSGGIVQWSYGLVVDNSEQLI